MCPGSPAFRSPVPPLLCDLGKSPLSETQCPYLYCGNSKAPRGGEAPEDCCPGWQSAFRLRVVGGKFPTPGMRLGHRC